MRKWQVTIYADRYPMTWTVKATSWSTAASRGVKLWQKRFKGSRADTLKITIVKGTVIDNENSNQDEQ